MLTYEDPITGERKEATQGAIDGLVQNIKFMRAAIKSNQERGGDKSFVVTGDGKSPLVVRGEK